MDINISPLINAVATFVIALEANEKQPDDLLIRDACIQRFEYCFELSHKMLRRVLMEMEAQAEDVAALSYPDLMRLAYVRELTGYEWRVWRQFRDVRNITSHAYDAEKAGLAMQSFPEFLAIVQDLVTRINARRQPL